MSVVFPYRKARRIRNRCRLRFNPSNSVIFHRADTLGGKTRYTAVIRGRISPAGNSLIDGGGFRFTWGSALNGIAGSDPGAVAAQNAPSPPVTRASSGATNPIEQESAPAPQPTAAPSEGTTGTRSPAVETGSPAVDLSGTWQSSDGIKLLVVQSGRKVLALNLGGSWGEAIGGQGDVYLGGMYTSARSLNTRIRWPEIVGKDIPTRKITLGTV
jgi:hypothetical protein